MDAVVDELYVLSDIHIGGPDGARMFHDAPLLGQTLRTLAARARADRRVAIMLNGDVFDFLAEAGPQPRGAETYFFPEHAARFLDRMAKAFAPAFDGMKAAVATAHCQLVIGLGNHDVELPVPEVAAKLRELLGADAGAGRLVLAIDGGGWRARVGHDEVLCLHGDRADPWNAVDHDRLRRIARAIRDGQAPEDRWVPTPGHQMVVEVVNPIKVKYPFFDLFQPQDHRILAVSRWVDPDMDAYRGRVARFQARASTRRIDLLSANGDPATPPDPLVPAADRLARVDRPDVDPLELADGGVLGLGQWLTAAFGRGDTLREALTDWLDDRAGFDPGAADETSTWVEKNISPATAFVVCGHTHVRKVIRRPAGGVYFNSGTWIPLLRLKSDDLATPEAGKRLIERLRSPTYAGLEGLLHKEPTVVCITREGRRAVGQLAEAVLTDGQVTLKPVGAPMRPWEVG